MVHRGPRGLGPQPRVPLSPESGHWRAGHARQFAARSTVCDSTVVPFFSKKYPGGLVTTCTARHPPDRRPPQLLRNEAGPDPRPHSVPGGQAGGRLRRHLLHCLRLPPRGGPGAGQWPAPLFWLNRVSGIVEAVGVLKFTPLAHVMIHTDDSSDPEILKPSHRLSPAWFSWDGSDGGA